MLNACRSIKNLKPEPDLKKNQNYTILRIVAY